MTPENMSNGNIYQAFLEAQKKIKPVKKDGKNPYFNSRYATLEAVINNVKEPLNDVGISILQPVMGDKVVTRLIFTDGTSIDDGGTPIVCKAINDPQAQGSAITYARRYGLMSILGLPADDDDAESATSHNEPTPRKAEPKKVEPKEPVTEQVISENQTKAIFAIMKSKGMSEEDLKTTFSFEHIGELSKQRASEIITILNKK